MSSHPAPLHPPVGPGDSGNGALTPSPLLARLRRPPSAVDRKASLDRELLMEPLVLARNTRPRSIGEFGADLIPGPISLLPSPYDPYVATGIPGNLMGPEHFRDHTPRTDLPQPRYDPFGPLYGMGVPRHEEVAPQQPRSLDRPASPSASRPF